MLFAHKHMTSRIPVHGGMCAVRLGHLICCLFLVLSYKVSLENLVAPYLLPTLGQFWGMCVLCLRQRGAGVTAVDSGIVFLENMMQVSLTPFLTEGVSFRH